MSGFLINNICEFRILNKVSFLYNGVNILSAVFFKRNEYYKNFGIYIKGLQKLFEFIDNKNNNPDANNFRLVLFIDQHINDDLTIMEMINSSHNTIPVLFKCAKYMKDNYHHDLFGTLIKFFPMFDFQDNPCNIVICVDIDLYDEDYVRLASVMTHKPNGITASGDFSKYFYSGQPPYVYAHLVCYNRKKFDHDMIMRFIEMADANSSKNYYGKRLRAFRSGIDDIFINDIMIPGTGTYRIIIDYQICYFLYHSKSLILSHDQIDISREILLMIIGDYAEKNKLSLPSDLLNFIDRETYQVRNRTKLTNELSRRFTHVIDYLQKNKKNWIEKEVQSFIHNYLKNVISCNLVIKYDYLKGIINVSKYDTVYDTDYVPQGYITEKQSQFDE
jgi:hypothetical protein